MKKILATILSASLLLFSLPAQAQPLPYHPLPGTVGDGISYNESVKPITVHVDGKYLPSDVPPQIVNSRTFVPLRAVSTALGADVQWNGRAQTVTISNAKGTTIFTIGSHTYVAAGVSKTLDAPAFIKNGRTLVPLRAAAESLGVAVDWSQQTADVSLTTGAPLVKANIPADTPDRAKWLIDKYYVESGDGIVGSYVSKDPADLVSLTGLLHNGIYHYLFISKLDNKKYQLIELFVQDNSIYISSEGFEQPVPYADLEALSGTGYQRGSDYIFNSERPIYFLTVPRGGRPDAQLTFKANGRNLVLLQSIYYPGSHLEDIETSYKQFTRF